MCPLCWRNPGLECKVRFRTEPVGSQAPAQLWGPRGPGRGPLEAESSPQVSPWGFHLLPAWLLGAGLRVPSPSLPGGQHRGLHLARVRRPAMLVNGCAGGASHRPLGVGREQARGTLTQDAPRPEAVINARSPLRPPLPRAPWEAPALGAGIHAQQPRTHVLPRVQVTPATAEPGTGPRCRVLRVAASRVPPRSCSV